MQVQVADAAKIALDNEDLAPSMRHAGTVRGHGT